MSRRVDLAIGIAIVVGGLLWIYGATLIHHTIEVDAIGEAGVPVALGVLFVAGGAVVALRAARAIRATAGVPAAPREAPEHPESDVRPIVIWGVSLAWTLGVPTVGFLVATPVLTAVLLWLLEYRSPWRVAVIAIATTVGLWLLLDVALRVNLPAGPLAPLVDPIHL